MPTFSFSEKHLSQIPALQQLINMGYRYLSPDQAMVERGGRASNVLLENILRDQLKKINRIRYKGDLYLFSEENIQSAIQKIKNVQYDGLQKTNEAIYDLITLGTSLEQTIESDSKSYTLNYIDWKNPANNVFHATAEFSVERARSIGNRKTRHCTICERHSPCRNRVQRLRCGCGSGHISNNPQSGGGIHPAPFHLHTDIAGCEQK